MLGFSPIVNECDSYQISEVHHVSESNLTCLLNSVLQDCKPIEILA